MCGEKRSDSHSTAMEGKTKMETVKASLEATKEGDNFIKG